MVSILSGIILISFNSNFPASEIEMVPTEIGISFSWNQLLALLVIITWTKGRLINTTNNRIKTPIETTIYLSALMVFLITGFIFILFILYPKGTIYKSNTKACKSMRYGVVNIWQTYQFNNLYWNIFKFWCMHDQTECHLFPVETACMLSLLETNIDLIKYHSH